MADESKFKGFWSKPEGTWGMILPVALVVLCFFFAGSIVPAVAAGFMALMTTVGFGIAYGILTLLLLALVHGMLPPNGWLLIAYMAFIYKLRRMVIDQNPLTILRMWKDKALARMKEIRDGKDEVAKQEVTIQKGVDKFTKDFNTFKGRAEALQGDPERQTEFRSAAGNMMKAAEYLKKSAERLALVKAQYKKIDVAYKDLEVMYKDMEYEESCLIQDYEMSGALDRVWTRIRTIFKGDNEWDKMREEAIESINNKYAERMGRVESAINDCQGKFDEIHLDREIKENDGVAMFNQLKGLNVDQIMASVSTPKAIAHTPVVDAQFTEVKSGYGSLIKR